ncbi:MAG: glycoside hydrolase family 3 C-terminal domain-containing protein [Anaerolineae bacterium]|nr:glycoside hydrolase family 3 C-terminal domain-containing protein [Anaerolineae bacterium]
MTDKPLYLDSSRSSDERAADLLGRLTLDEKLAQIGSCWAYELVDGVTFSPAKARARFAQGIGHVTRVGGSTNVTPRQSAELNNAIQRFLKENTRLGIPAVIHEECCSGYMASGATVFPQAIGVASTWEPALVEAMADVIRRQMRSVGGHHALAPVLDIARDARWGRTEETFGEDPYLIAQMGCAYVRGIQGDSLRDGVVATGKHFVGYGMSEGGMNWAPPHIMPRELREVHLYPFEAAVRDARLASIMNGYHEIDGVPCGSSELLLTDILREEWGFDGTVVSDYFAVTQLYEYHHIARDKSEAARLALEAGLDVELPGADSFGAPLKAAVEAGRVPMELVDRAVLRLLRQKFTLGLFENPFVDVNAVQFDLPAERDLARQIARDSLVLLRNEGDLLPLSKDLKSIAVIGPNADSMRNLFGDYAYPAHIETLMEMMLRRNTFHMPPVGEISEADDFITAQSVLEALREARQDAVIHYAQGCDVRGPSTDGFAEAVEAARQAEVAILVMGDKAGLTDECTSGEARDRAVLDLPGVQEQLVRAVYETGTPVVLVLVNGRPVTLNWMAEAIPAILECWLPGEEGGRAIVDTLWGDSNPGGKLPISFPRTVGQVPVFYSHPPSGGRSHWKGEYVETSNQPLYPFGYGLSYTRFALDNLRLDRAQASAGESVNITIDVTNVGARAGSEVVQLYTHQQVSGVTRPLQILKGFKRVQLEPEQKQTVVFRLPVEQLGFFNLALDHVLEAGTVEVMIGTSSADIRARASFQIASGGAVKRVYETPAEVT